MASNKLVKNLLHFYWRFSRPMTLGVRAIVEKEPGNILLVRHTYVDGWHLPGGGVESGQTIEQAIERELIEEANVRINTRPQLLAFYKNEYASVRDHVALFYITEFEQRQAPQPNNEIAEVIWCAFESLPKETTSGTRRRLEEFYRNEPHDPYW